MQHRTITVNDLYKSAAPATGNPDNLFIIKDYSGIAALKYWLKNRQYNCFIKSKDKRGKTLFGLIWDYNLGSFPSPNRRERGAIIVLDDAYMKETALKIIAGMKVENDYAKMFRQAQYDLWKYGIDEHKALAPQLRRGAS